MAYTSASVCVIALKFIADSSGIIVFIRTAIIPHFSAAKKRRLDSDRRIHTRKNNGRGDARLGTSGRYMIDKTAAELNA
jgi:hypothetical protein